MKSHLDTALDAARAAGELLRSQFGQKLDVNEFSAHDIKLDLDVRTQQVISDLLLGAHPDHAFFGEEGISGNQASEWQWIVDPIDGTVNYFYSIPHFCISIALRRGDEMQLGVIFDPMRDELWSVERGGAATLNGAPVAVSPRTQLGDAVLSVGLSKNKAAIAAGLPLLERYASRARKCRLMGSAALDLAYVACGRLDAYIEQSVSLWDVAAGKILVESAGGKVEMQQREDNPGKFSVVAWNGKMDLAL
jgi:myo-inositol-1(or 4)-monophosphatase